MKLTPRHVAATLGALAVSAAAACTPAPTAPVPDFGANGGTPVGMPGMSAVSGRVAHLPEASSATTPPASVSAAAVAIANFAFTPATLTVKVGDTVTWANRDEEPHTIAAADGAFHSPGMGTNAMYSFTFTKPGNYEYVCGVHPFMHGTVVVTP